jgi:hypothetical protein
MTAFLMLLFMTLLVKNVIVYGCQVLTMPAWLDCLVVKVQGLEVPHGVGTH